MIAAAMKDLVPPPPPIVRNQFETIRELFSRNVVPSYGRFDVALSHGAGLDVHDQAHAASRVRDQAVGRAVAQHVIRDVRPAAVDEDRPDRA